MSPKHASTRTLPARPDLTQLKRQAKELLQAFGAGDPIATAEVQAHYQSAHRDTFALHDAQLVLARLYGYPSWPKLKAFIDGATVGRLAEAVRAGDLETVRSMVTLRPELVHMDMSENDEHRALHYAVLARQPDIARVLLQHGASPHKGIWPHRDATTPLRMATERGYTELVNLMATVERRDMREPSTSGAAAPATMPREAPPSAREAIARGDIAWLRANADEVRLASQRRLLSHAIHCNRADVLSVLLELGLDPDERERVGGLEELVPSWGEALRECASSGQLAMAETLLQHGADANTNVYAASSALFNAIERRDDAMVALLERHGARLDPTAVGIMGLTEHASRLLAEAAASHPPTNSPSSQFNVAQALLWGSVESASPEIVRMALAHIDWPRDDERWYGILQNGLYPGSVKDGVAYLEGLRLVLDRANPNVTSKRGATLLHYLAAAHGDRTPDDRLTRASLLLDAGARLDLRDDLLQSTPLGWACRWGRPELVRLFLERGADSLERNAEPWATPMAWATRMNHSDVLAILQEHAR